MTGYTMTSKAPADIQRSKSDCLIVCHRKFLHRIKIANPLTKVVKFKKITLPPQNLQILSRNIM